MAERIYNLRGVTRNYRQLSSLNIPRTSRTTQPQDKLYPVEVVERNGSRVRIHYVGYDNSTDEWRELTDLVSTNSTSRGTNGDNTYNSSTISNTIIQPYNLYNELRVKIKQALVCSRKQSPVVTIDMGFDYLLFKGGLQAAGIPKRLVCGNQRYKLQSYRDVDSLLGQNWHYRGINRSGDYAFVVLHTIEYYIHRRRSITEYYPSDSSPTLHTIDTGYSLKFSFVRGYGNGSTFGKDRDIFS